MLVSVIIPCYKGERYLDEAIGSALHQTTDQLEVIVVDDGSPTSGPRDVVARYGDAVRYLHKENGGLSSARNAGIAVAAGDVIAFLDDDDVWFPEKIEKQRALLERLRSEGREVGLISTAFIYADEELNEISRCSMPYAGDVFDELMLTDLVGLPSSVIIPREVLRDVGGFNEDLKASEDYDLWLRIAARYEIFSLDEYLVKYRQRPSTLSKNPERMVAANQRVTEMLIAREALDETTVQAIWAARRGDYARRHRRHGYEMLKFGGDARRYRGELARAREYDATVVQLKDRLVAAFPWAYRMVQRARSGPGWHGRARTPGGADQRAP